MHMWEVVGDRRLQVLFVLNPRRKGKNENVGCKFLQGPQGIESKLFWDDQYLFLENLSHLITFNNSQ